MPNFLTVNSSGPGHAEVAPGTTGGAGDANKIPQLDANGQLTSSMMPTGIGADTQDVVASEALSAGDLVQIYDNAGTPNVRKADKASGKAIDGFVIAAVASAATATVYFEGRNTGVSGLTGGTNYYLGGNGALTATQTSTSGEILQFAGKAVGATVLAFEASVPTLRA